MKTLNRHEGNRNNHLKALVSACALLTCLFFYFNSTSAPILRFLHKPEPPSVVVDNGFDWGLLNPSRKLDYRQCYGKFQCARLELPMDWTADEDHQWDHTVAIALIKLPANVSASDPRYGGEVYVNPGGPGSSGVRFARSAGEELVRLVGAGGDDAKQFDIVGFDPRGIMHSTPRPTCFPDLKSRQLWYHMTETYNEPTNSNATFKRLLARTEAYRKMCDPGDDQSSEDQLLKSHMSSAYVARDLLAIIDRSAEATRDAGQGRPAGSHIGSNIDRPKATLQYWGFSYGTMLGGYFASMFPDRVERMVLDANGNFEHWISGNRSGFLTQTPAAMKGLYSTCFAAGPDRCALFDKRGSDAIETSVSSNLAKLRASPMPIWTDGMLVPDVLTYEKVITSIFRSFYNPYQSFPQLAHSLAALQDGRNVSALEKFLSKRELTCTDQVCRTPGCLDKPELYLEPGLAYLNSDSTLNGTQSDFFEVGEMLKGQSLMFGEMFQVDAATGWNAWPVEPKWRFTGPMGGRTKHPILFVGNTGDPVGPIQNAIDNAKLFDGAVALTQDSLAHGSISAPSACTEEYIRGYFQHGTLPGPGVVCRPDWLPFQKPLGSNDVFQLAEALYNRFA